MFFMFLTVNKHHEQTIHPTNTQTQTNVEKLASSPLVFAAAGGNNLWQKEPAHSKTSSSK